MAKGNGGHSAMTQQEAFSWAVLFCYHRKQLYSDHELADLKITPVRWLSH